MTGRRAQRNRGDAAHEDFFASFKPVAPGKGEHFWRISDGHTDTHGYGARCDRCGLELVPCVDILQAGYAPSAALYVAGRSERYDARKHGRCPS